MQDSVYILELVVLHQRADFDGWLRDEFHTLLPSLLPDLGQASLDSEPMNNYFPCQGMFPLTESGKLHLRLVTT